jgi:hypothetical protein
MAVGRSLGLMDQIVSHCDHESRLAVSRPSIDVFMRPLTEMKLMTFSAAMGDFWRSRNQWQPTWSDDPEDRSLVVYVIKSPEACNFPSMLINPPATL